MTKEQIIANFDPSQPGLADATVFGLPFSAEQSEIIVIPVPLFRSVKPASHSIQKKSGRKYFSMYSYNSSILSRGKWQEPLPRVIFTAAFRRRPNGVETPSERRDTKS